MKDAATKSYSKKGMDIVEMNHKAIDAGATAFVKIDVPACLGQRCSTTPRHRPSSRASPSSSSMVKEILDPVGQDGRRQPAGLCLYGSRRPASSSRALRAYEKRGVAVTVPELGSRTSASSATSCAYVCPHATIRPVRS